jgi:hypothetical protein
VELRDLRSLLNDWARWKSTGPDAARRWMPDRIGVSVPGSRPPFGVELPETLGSLVEAMELLPYFQDIGEAMMTVKVIYLRNNNASLEDVAETLGISMTRLKERRRVAESALLGWMVARGF